MARSSSSGVWADLVAIAFVMLFGLGVAVVRSGGRALRTIGPPAMQAQEAALDRLGSSVPALASVTSATGTRFALTVTLYALVLAPAGFFLFLLLTNPSTVLIVLLCGMALGCVMAGLGLAIRATRGAIALRHRWWE